jgi:hypothetical protein
MTGISFDISAGRAGTTLPFNFFLKEPENTKSTQFWVS